MFVPKTIAKKSALDKIFILFLLLRKDWANKRGQRKSKFVHKLCKCNMQRLCVVRIKWRSFKGKWQFFSLNWHAIVVANVYVYFFYKLVCVVRVWQYAFLDKLIHQRAQIQFLFWFWFRFLYDISCGCCKYSGLWKQASAKNIELECTDLCAHTHFNVCL